MINKLLNIFSKNKKSIFFILFFVFAFFAFSDISFAMEEKDFAEVKKTVSSVLTFVTSFVSIFLGLITYLSVIFLSPEWINGSLFGLNEYFKDIWILVSNVVYFIFAFILIWIAFMNIIGKGQDKYQLKQALPKFLIGILIVPLSWFIVNFILSISAILTVAAINLPYDTFKDYQNKIGEIPLPSSCVLDLSNVVNSSSDNTSGTTSASSEGTTGGEGSSSGGTNSKKFFDCPGPKIPINEIMNSSASYDRIFTVLGTYTYGLLGIEGFDKIGQKFELDAIKTIGDLIIKIVFDLLFVLVYSVLMIALALVLITRGIYIWIYLMISPVFGLMYFFDKSSGGGEFFDKFNIKQFFSLAMVPVYTMLALSFGLLFMYVVGSNLGKTEGTTITEGINIELADKKGGNDILTVGKFKLEIVGPASNPDNITKFIEKIGGGALGVIGTLIMKIFGIVILWGSVMAALRSNDVTKAVVEPLHAFGSQVGQLAAKSPQYAPIFGGQSMQSLSSAASSFKSGIEGYHSQRGADIGRSFSDSIVGGDKAVRKIEDSFRSITATDGKAIAEAIETTLPHVDTNNHRHVEKLIEALEKVGFENLEVDSIKGKSKDQIARYLMENQNDILRSHGFDDYSDYMKILESNISSGVGDNQSYGGTRDSYNDFSGENVREIELQGDYGIKVSSDSETGNSTIMLDRGGDRIMNYNLRFDTTDLSFSEMTSSDQKEIIDLYSNLTGPEKSKIKDILTGIGLTNIEDDIKDILEERISSN